MTNADELIGLNLQRLRGDLTQTSIANTMKEMGHKWSQPTVVSIEKGERPLRLAEARDVAAILGVAISDLIKAPSTAQLEDMLNRLGNAAVQARVSLADWQRVREEALQLAEAYSAESPKDIGETGDQARAFVAKIREMADQDGLPAGRGGRREAIPDFFVADISEA